MNEKIIDSLKKLTLRDNEIIHISVKEGTSPKEMKLLALLMKKNFPLLDGKWIMTPNTYEFSKLNKDELTILIEMLQKRKDQLTSNETTQVHKYKPASFDSIDWFKNSTVNDFYKNLNKMNSKDINFFPNER